MIRKSLQKLFSWVNKYDIQDCEVVSLSGRDSVGEIGKQGMNFTIHPATGGYIMEYRVYDKKNDRNDNKLHIINNDQDLGESIGKIITMEILRS
jgi:hypothetical protein